MGSPVYKGREGNEGYQTGGCSVNLEKSEYKPRKLNPILIKSLDRKNLGDKNKKEDHNFGNGNSLNSGYLGTKILQPSVSKINLRKHAHGSPSYLDRKLRDTQRTSRLSKRSSSSQPSRVLSIKPLGKNSLLTPQLYSSNQNSGRVTPINVNLSSSA